MDFCDKETNLILKLYISRCATNREPDTSSLGAKVCTRVEIKLYCISYCYTTWCWTWGPVEFRGPLISCTESPAACLAHGPCHTEWKQQGRRGGGLGNLSLHLSIVIFISFILTHPLFLPSSTSRFLSSFFLSFAFFLFAPHSLIFMLDCQLCCLPLLGHSVVVSPPHFLASLCSPMLHLTRPICSPLSTPSELCLLAISYFPSASSPSSSSSATKMARLHDPLCVTWLSSRSFHSPPL